MADDPPRSGPVIFKSYHGAIVNNRGRLKLVAAGPARHIVVSMSDREIEVPEDSGLVDYLVAIAKNGGVVFLTRDGERVAAVVDQSIAESIARDRQDDDVDVALRDALSEELAIANGPVGQEELDEVERVWRAETSE